MDRHTTKLELPRPEFNTVLNFISKHDAIKTIRP